MNSHERAAHRFLDSLVFFLMCTFVAGMCLAVGGVLSAIALKSCAHPIPIEAR